MLNIIEDVQNSKDNRNIPIDKVGIKDIKHPVTVIDTNGKKQHTVANINMYVNLCAKHKGTHMSRFIELLNQQETIISMEELPKLLQRMNNSLNSHNSFIEVSFPFFIKKQAPLSKVESLLDYSITLSCTYIDGSLTIDVKSLVPVTSLCPCSKKISKYGAHNQRSHLEVKVRTAGSLCFEDLISMIEKEASCELYGLLKRPDEKYVTERAYENPKFVEDLVRDIAAKLNNNDDILAYEVSSENFESIHNHSAYAILSKDKSKTD